MKIILLIIGSSLFFLSTYSQNKRGLAYGYHSAKDLEVLAPNISWWYNWSITPETPVANVFENYGFDFVPMTWNNNYSVSKLRDFLSTHPTTKYILAFNEPNFIGQANMTPSQAAAAWPKLEAIADEFDLKIVAPAVNFCGVCVTENGTTYTDPFEYLDDFFAACPDCRIDHIAIHSYMDNVDALKWYVDEFKKYNKPIWLTEFAGYDLESYTEQIDYMINAVDYLELEPDIFRYSWFIGRTDNTNGFPYIDILGASGILTDLGEMYKNLPTHNFNQIISVPALIEAETYNNMSGVSLKATDDQTGLFHVSNIENNDWIEFKINVPETGNYEIRFRIESVNASALDVLIDNTSMLRQNIQNTGDGLNWQTLINTIQLTVGVHKLKIKAATGGFNLNWMRISNSNPTAADIINRQNDFVVFPNPSTGNLNLETTYTIETIRITNMIGTCVLNLPFSKTIQLNGLPSGIYYCSAIDKQGETVAKKKILIH